MRETNDQGVWEICADGSKALIEPSESYLAEMASEQSALDKLDEIKRMAARSMLKKEVNSLKSAGKITALDIQALKDAGDID